MKVTVKLFARARDLARQDRVEIDLAEGVTVAQLRGELARQVPALSSFVQRCAIAIDGEYTVDSDVVSARGEVALIPPVSGG